MLKPMFRLSVAAAIVVAVAGVLWFGISRSGSMAFADVIANVNGVQSVSYALSGTVDVPGQGPMPISSEVLVAEPSHMRQVTEPGGMIMIWDFAAGKMLTLVPGQKTATLLNLTNQPKQMTEVNVLDQFKHLDSNAFEPMPGEKTIDGHVVVGFKPKAEAANSLMWQTFWVDKETRLPVQMDVKMPGGVMPKANMVMRDFKWNVPVDAASFSLTPPPGYQVQTASMDTTPATEAEFVAGLRSLAEMNNNTFPDALDLTTAVQIVTKHVMQTNEPKTPENMKALQEQLLPVMTKMTRAIFFPASPVSGSDFHYAGKGIALDQLNTPILWYRPKDARTYRVINADLIVHNVDPNELPQVQSVSLSTPKDGSGGPSTRPDSPTSRPAPAVDSRL